MTQVTDCCKSLSPLLYSLNYAAPDEIFKIYILFRLTDETVKEMSVSSLIC